MKRGIEHIAPSLNDGLANGIGREDPEERNHDVLKGEGGGARRLCPLLHRNGRQRPKQVPKAVLPIEPGNGGSICEQKNCKGRETNTAENTRPDPLLHTGPLASPGIHQEACQLLGAVLRNHIHKGLRLSLLVQCLFRGEPLLNFDVERFMTR